MDLSNSKPSQEQKVWSFGLNYNYSFFRKGFSPFFTYGLYVSGSSGGNIDASPKFNTGIVAVGAKTGLGISWKPLYCLNISLYPVFYYNFNSIKSSELKTRFYTGGLEAGLFLNIGSLKPI